MRETIEIYNYKYQNSLDFGSHFKPICLIFSRGRMFLGWPVFWNLCKAPKGHLWSDFAFPQGTHGALFLLFLCIQEQVCSRYHPEKCIKKSLKIPHPPSSRTCRSLINPPSQSIRITRVSNLEDHEDWKKGRRTPEGIRIELRRTFKIEFKRTPVSV